MDTISNLTFKQSLEKAVGVAVSFNCDADPVAGEEHPFMLGVRMVFGHFLDATKRLSQSSWLGCAGSSATKSLRLEHGR